MRNATSRILIGTLAGTLAGTLLVAASASAQDRSDWPESFTVGTASQGGTYFVYGSGWANLIADELGISGGGEVTGGCSAPN